ncbi:tetratricopeptide repeat protein [Catenulispora yoronensis]
MRGRGRGTDPQWITQEFARAEDLAAAGQMERARDRYAKLARRLAAAPEDVAHYRGLALLGEAETILAMGVFTDAMVRFREAYPLLTEPFRQLPRWLVRQFAEERLRVEDGDLRPVTDFLQALTYGVEAGDEDTAVRTIVWLQERCLTGPNAQREATARAALAALPGVDWPVLALTTMLRRDGRVKEAEDLLAEWVPGGSGELWFRWGVQLSTLRRYDQAISAYDEAERRGTGQGSPWSRGPWLRPEAMLFRGLAHQQMGRTGHAEQDLRAASAVAPQDPRVHYSLGRLSVQLGADYQAWGHFTTALAVENAFAPARLGLALLREQSGRPAEAIAHYQAALRHDGSSRAARIRLGAVLLAAGRRDEAEELLHPEAEESSYWGGMASFHYGLAQLRANDPAGALTTWEKLRTGELRDWIAVARDREARKRLGTNPTAARLQLQLALLDAPEIVERRVALREAALREAAWMLLAGRELPEQREKAAVALDLAASLPVEDGVDGRDGVDVHRARQNRLRGLVDLAGGATGTLPDFLDAAGTVRDRSHLAVAAVVDGRVGQALALLVDLPADPGCDPEIARVRALVAERTGDWGEAVLWYQRFLDNDVVSYTSGESADTEDADSLSDAADGDPSDVDDAESTLTLDVNEIALAGERAAAKKAGGGRRRGARAAVRDRRGRRVLPGSERHLRRLRPRRLRRAPVPADRDPLPPVPALRRVGPARRPLRGAPRRHAGRGGADHRHVGGRAGEHSSQGPPAPPARPAPRRVRRPGRRAGTPARRRRGRARRPAHPARRRGDPPGRAVPGARRPARSPARPARPAAGQSRAGGAGRVRGASACRGAAQPRGLRQLPGPGPRRTHEPPAAARAGPGRLPPGPRQPEPGALAVGRRLPGLGAPRAGLPAAGDRRDAGGAGVRAGAVRRRPRRPDGGAAGRAARRRRGQRARRGRGRCLDRAPRHGRLRLPDQPDPQPDAGRAAAGAAGDAGDPGVARPDRYAARHGAGGDGGVGRGRKRRRCRRYRWRRRCRRRGAAENWTAAFYGALGPQHFLYEDGRYEAAIAGLDTVPEDERDQEWTALLRKTLVMRGMELHLDEHWADALECIARAASLTPDVAPEAELVEIAVESGLNAAHAVLGGRSAGRGAGVGSGFGAGFGRRGADRRAQGRRRRER